MLQYANLIEALEAAPADRPFITSCIDEDDCETVTFAEFRQLARAQMEAYRQQGIAAGDRLIVIMPQGIPAMVAFAAAMMLGAVPAFLPYPNFKVEPSKYRSGLAGVTANLTAKAVIIDEEFPDEMLECVSLREGAKLLRVGGKASRTNFGLARSSAEALRIERESIAFIQHSAGTTGLQKGVALSHRAVLQQISHLCDALKISDESDRIYSWLPLYHDMGLIACFMLPMVCHVPVVMQSPIDWVMRPESMLQVVSGHKCTLAWMPNFAFQFIPRRTPQNRWKEYDLSSLRLLINCSEPVRADSMKEFENAFEVRSGVLQSCYAMAENVFAVTQSDIDRGPAIIWADAQQFRASHKVACVTPGTPGALSLTSSGKLLSNQRIQILSDSGEVLAENCVGEIVIQGDCLFDGYYNRPDLTARAVVDGRYLTGDLGFLRENELYVVGRKKDLLIVGGENIYPQDIEEIVAGHPAIHDGRVVAIGLYNADLGTEDIVIVAEVEDERQLENADGLEQEIRSKITASLGLAVRKIFLRPPRWIIKSTAGKPARSATREKLLQEHPELKVEA